MWKYYFGFGIIFSVIIWVNQFLIKNSPVLANIVFLESLQALAMRFCAKSAELPKKETPAASLNTIVLSAYLKLISYQIIINRKILRFN